MKYFGTDGIRGEGFTFLSAKLAFLVGASMKKALNKDRLVIGMDTRESSPMLAHMVAAGAMSKGMDIIFAGICPTPAMALYSLKKNTAGVMITASHNPYFDNGIKVFNNGFKTTIDEEKDIESYIENEKYDINFFGEFTLSNSIEELYFSHLDSLNISYSNIKVAYDSANGANYLYSKKAMNKYAPNSIQIHNNPNGTNINYECGSTHLDSITRFIKENNMDLGFAYDGDGDRVLMVGSDGSVYDGDMIIYVIAKYLKHKNMLNHNTVVLTKMSNPGVLKALTKEGINYVLTDVGDKYVSEQLELNDYVLGGEASGHIIIKNILHSGDGLLASLYILKILEEEKLSLEEYTKDIELYPLVVENISNINKDVLKQENVIRYLEDIKTKFDKEDIFFIRASGTEPLIRVTISCKDESKLNKYLKEVVNYIKEEGNNL